MAERADNQQAEPNSKARKRRPRPQKPKNHFNKDNAEHNQTRPPRPGQDHRHSNNHQEGHEQLPNSSRQHDHDNARQHSYNRRPNWQRRKPKKTEQPPPLNKDRQQNHDNFAAQLPQNRPRYRVHFLLFCKVKLLTLVCLFREKPRASWPCPLHRRALSSTSGTV